MIKMAEYFGILPNPQAFMEKNTVTCPLIAGIVYSEMMPVCGQWLCKYVSAATAADATLEELLENRQQQ
jgi:hypothetical protein